MTKPKKKTEKKTVKSTKKALGKGLDALIPDMGAFDEKAGEAAPQAFFECDVDRIIPNRYQPRVRFSPEELEDLSRSISRQGILQPLLVRDTGASYELIAGERRFRAAKMAGLASVPVMVKDVSDTEMLEMSIIENIQRENLNPIEEAEAYYRLINEFEMTQDQAAKRLGKSRSAVANILRLRNLPPEIKESITEGQLSMGHARALLGAKNTAQQLAAWRAVTVRGLSVRQTEALVDQLKNQVSKEPKTPSSPSSEDIYYSDLSEGLSREYGTKVLIQRSGTQGKVVFEYYSNEELDRLLKKFSGGDDDDWPET